MSEGRALRAELEAMQARRRGLEKELQREFDPALRAQATRLEVELQPLRRTSFERRRAVASLQRNVSSLEDNRDSLGVEQRAVAARREVSFLGVTIAMAAMVASFALITDNLDAPPRVVLSMAAGAGFLLGFVFRFRLKAD